MTKVRPAANPFRIGGPAVGDQFADRERELRKFRSLMLNGQNLVLIAPRRFGKTSLLLRLVTEVRDRGGRSGRQSLLRCSDSREVAETMLKAVLEGPMGGVQGYLREVVDRLSRLRVVPQISLDPASLLPSVSLAPGAAEVDWKEVCSEVVRLLNQVAAEGHRVSLVLDEFQKVREIQADLPDIFKDMTDELKGVSLVFAGSKPALMRELVDEQHGALFQVGAVHELGVIPRKEFVAFLVERAAAGGKELPVPLAERMYDLAHGVPHDVQLLAYFAFDAAAGRIGDPELSEALVSAIGDQKVAFEAQYPTAPSQQRLLKLIARQGRVAEPQAQVVLHYLDVSSRASSKAVQALIRSGLIERDETGGLRLVRGLFELWLRGEFD